MLETIIRYLVQGVSGKEIASIVGCSEGYVSQVKARDDFELLCEDQKKYLVVAEQKEKLEKKYEDLEDQALKSLKENMPYAEFSEVTKLLEILHRKKQPNGVNVQINNHNNTQNNDNRVQNVILQLPQAAIPEIRLNSQSEVIGIGDESLAPMNATNVKSLFAQLTLKKEMRDKQKQKELSEMRIVATNEREKIVSQEDL